jgi:hypothetical protein
MAIGSSDGQYFNDEAEHFLVSRGIKPVISDQKLAGQGQFKTQDRVKTQDRLPQTDNPFNLKKEPPEDRRLLDPTPMMKKAEIDLPMGDNITEDPLPHFREGVPGPKDANQPVVDPKEKPRKASPPPPIVPGAEGEYLTS